jgi:hypothetical protein
MKTIIKKLSYRDGTNHATDFSDVAFYRFSFPTKECVACTAVRMLSSIPGKLVPQVPCLSSLTHSLRGGVRRNRVRFLLFAADLNSPC